MILCPHETIISKSEADFDTQRRRRAPRDLEGSVTTLLRLPNRFAPLAKVCVVTHFIIVGGLSERKRPQSAGAANEGTLPPDEVCRLAATFGICAGLGNYIAGTSPLGGIQAVKKVAKQPFGKN